jgi:hypothetical protein
MYPSPRLGGNRRQRSQALKKTCQKRGPQRARHALQYSLQTQKDAAKEKAVSTTFKHVGFLTLSKDCL